MSQYNSFVEQPESIQYLIKSDNQEQYKMSDKQNNLSNEDINRYIQRGKRARSQVAWWLLRSLRKLAVGLLKLFMNTGNDLLNRLNQVFRRFGV